MLVLVCVCMLSGISFGAEKNEIQSNGQDALSVMITVPFPNFSETRVLQWDFPYDDSYFLESSHTFSRELAKATMGLTLSAFRNNIGLMDNQYATYLEGAGFSDIYAFGYDKETSKDTISGVIAHKKIGDFTLIAATPCGQGYKKEWAGNLEVGDEERHVGFNHAAEIVEKEIRSYLESHHLEGPLKLWLGGFSRASAVANLTAADMIDSGLFEDVYAYLFAVPRTTKDPEFYRYQGIYNICGKYDPVAQIPAEAWGFFRYGTDLYIPAMEMDSQYLDLAGEASKVNWALMGDEYWYNPVVNYQLHLIIEFLCELFPTNAEYAEKLQESLMKIWSEADPETFATIFILAIEQLDDLDQRQEYSSSVFVEYLTLFASSIISEKDDKGTQMYWNSKQGAVDNLMREHMPYTYLNWVFSNNPEVPLYHGPDIARRVYIYGNVDVEVWKNGRMIQGIDQNGREYFPELDRNTLNENGFSFNYVFLIRNGTETLTSLPYDGTYQIRIKTRKDEYITVYDLFSTPRQTFGLMDDLDLIHVSEGEYKLDFSEYTDEFSVEAIDGEVLERYSVPYQYSPTMIMGGECDAVEYLTLPDMILIFVGVALFIVLLLLICLVIAIVHKIRKKKRGKPYSPWFVIIPHLLIVALFTYLTEFYTMHMFTIVPARTACAFVTMAAICLLALRGLIRNRCVRNAVIFAGLLAATVVNVAVYQNSPLASSRLLTFIIYCICIAGLCALAVSTFFSRRHQDGISKDGGKPNE